MKNLQENPQLELWQDVESLLSDEKKSVELNCSPDDFVDILVKVVSSRLGAGYEVFGLQNGTSANGYFEMTKPTSSGWKEIPQNCEVALLDNDPQKIDSGHVSFAIKVELKPRYISFGNPRDVVLFFELDPQTQSSVNENVMQVIFKLKCDVIRRNLEKRRSASNKVKDIQKSTNDWLEEVLKIRQAQE